MSQAELVADLRHQLRVLGARIEGGDESQLLVWVIPSQLACCHRPLRFNQLYGGSLRNLDATATPLVFDWARRIRGYGIESILCLMSEEELALYERLNLGEKNLLEFYRAQGFQVASVPWKDPAHLRVNPTALRDKQRQISRAALSSFDALQKPVVLHCSAGIDRSAPVAAYIYSQRCGS